MLSVVHKTDAKTNRKRIELIYCSWQSTSAVYTNRRSICS